jgi:predicted metal-dependent hydrolase
MNLLNKSILQTKKYNHHNLFDCDIIYSPRRKRSICISIRPEGVIVRAPIGAAEKSIIDFIHRKEKFILQGLKTVSKIVSNTSKPLYERKFIYFLGQKYLLKICQSKLLKKGGFCEIDESYFCANISETENCKRNLEEIVKNWYRKRALEIFNERVEYLAKLHNFAYKKVRIGEQKSLWGSCTNKNHLSFNWKVVQCNINVVDYLIIHELTHTLHRDHSRKFWAKVGEILPNYKELKRSLKEMKMISI